MYCNIKNKKSALKYLCKFTNLLEKEVLCVQRNEKQFSRKMILETTLNFTFENQAFELLHEEKQYHEIKDKLKKLLEEYYG